VALELELVPVLVLELVLELVPVLELVLVLEHLEFLLQDLELASELALALVLALE
jgi:hypothetical protein